MTKAYYSTVFEQPAAVVWAAIRDFNNYSVWVNGEGISEIEDGKSGDTVGAVRNVLVRERRIRQRLLALSDVERSQTYEFCGPPSLPVEGFMATLRVTPVVDGDHAFVEWWASFDCEPARSAELVGTLSGWFGAWLTSLRTVLGGGPNTAQVEHWRPSAHGSGPIRRLWP